MTVRVAAVQDFPVFMDLDGTVERTVAWIGKARAAGAHLAAFPETWVPGYPAWLDVSPSAGLWDHTPAKDAFGRLVANAVTVPGPALATIQDAARAHEMTVVIGVHERVVEGPGRRTLFNTVLTIGPDGSLLNHHRKLVPTYTERLVWGRGEGGGLHAPQTPAGRVGALICWEHWMPLTRHVMHVAGEDIHVAQWPMVKEMNLVASRHYAFEGRCFVVATGALLRASQLPESLPASPEVDPEALILRGGSAVIAPDGRYLAGPVYDEPALVTADLDLAEIAKESMALDVTGHYHRPDLFKLELLRS